MCKNHIDLHHSQTSDKRILCGKCVRTILIYIILKLSEQLYLNTKCVRTILIYIILKLAVAYGMKKAGVRTILIYIILKHKAWEVYEELVCKNHIDLHHSQTKPTVCNQILQCKNHIDLHHSQTSNSKMKMPSHIKQYSP